QAEIVDIESLRIQDDAAERPGARGSATPDTRPLSVWTARPLESRARAATPFRRAFSGVVPVGAAIPTPPQLAVSLGAAGHARFPVGLAGKGFLDGQHPAGREPSALRH